MIGSETSLGRPLSGLLYPHRKAGQRVDASGRRRIAAAAGALAEYGRFEKEPRTGSVPQSGAQTGEN